MQHFEIMVNAMLSWADESKAPRKAPARSATVMMRGERDELDDDEPFVDDEDDDEELNMKAGGDAGMPAAAQAADADAEAEAESELD
jgi:hypothetical protein